MTLTRNRLLTALALPLSVGLLAACGSDSGTATTTETATVAATTETSAPSTSASPQENSANAATSPSEDDETTTQAASPSATTGSGSTADGSGGVPSAFTAMGTEPFWDVAVDGRTLTYSGVDVESKVLEAERTTTSNTATYTGNHEGAAYRMVVTVGSCNDGMSDNEYPYTVSWTYDGQTNQGCAR